MNFHEIPAPALVLFAGAGGSSIGLHDAGFVPIGYEYWKPAADTHRANGMVCHDHDLSDPTLDFLIGRTPLLWASPPCQPFSAAGDGEGEFDDRDGFPWTLRIIDAKRPQVVIIENVKGLTFAKHHAYFAGILASLRGLGYDVDWRVLNSADYGVPQTRERCFIVGRRDGGRITWPMPTHTEQAGMLTEPWVTMADALGWGEGLAIKYSRGAGLEERHGERRPHPFTEPAPSITTHAEKDYKIVLRAGSPTNATVRQLSEPAPTVLANHDSSGWCWVRPATTINGDPRVSAPGHHDPTVSGSQQADAIRLTIAELARLQDFPDHYEWCGTKTDQARQIGNAVPPTMARMLAAANRPALAVAS